MDENYDVRDDYKDGNEGLKDPGRQERRRPDELWSQVLSLLVISFCWLYLYINIWIDIFVNLR